MNDQERAAIAIVCKIIQDAGQPVSRLEITRAIKHKRVMDLSYILGLMLKEKIIIAKQDSTENSTLVLRYVFAKGFDFDKWKESGN
jgi:hypothetical protein